MEQTNIIIKTIYIKYACFGFGKTVPGVELLIIFMYRFVRILIQDA